MIEILLAISDAMEKWADGESFIDRLLFALVTFGLVSIIVGSLGW